MVLTEAARVFIADYSDAYEEYRQLAVVAERFVREHLRDHDYALHLVTGRAKDPESLRGKVLLRPYKDPANEIMDLIGVRVITYYAEQVDEISKRLRACLTIDRANSLDKRSTLEERGQFGYRSVHILGRISPRHDPSKEYKLLRGRVIEIQVRSVLDHAWAEVEHEIVYKSGIDYPPSVRRRLAAIAGSFEILEKEFLSLRGQRDIMVDQHVQDYLARRKRGETFDAARLLAAFEALRPAAKGWRRAAQVGSPLPVPIKTVLAAMHSVSLDNYSALSKTLQTQRCRTKIESFASLAGLAPDELSHLLLAALVVGDKDPEALRVYFPDIAARQDVTSLFGLDE